MPFKWDRVLRPRCLNPISQSRLMHDDHGANSLQCSDVRFGSKPVRLRSRTCFPVYPQQRTFVSTVGTSVQGQTRTSTALYSITSSARGIGPLSRSVNCSRWRDASVDPSFIALSYHSRA
jgi:hypothetical protein